ncbi:IS66 family transposase [Alkaliphilus sp. AH-315-G20]|nr:IS66 family transposase [Alkaliphilus sp. AH-315-G20]
MDHTAKLLITAFIGVYATGKVGPPIFLYDYRTTRAKKHPQNFLEKFKGFLHVDGYSGYHDIPDVTLVGCIAHARRKFADALKAVPKGTDVSNLPASKGLEYCNELFKLERKFKDLEPDERHKLRKEQTQPVLDAFLEYLETSKKQALPKSTFGTAINYCLNQWTKLKSFMADPNLEISNNRAERAIKPFVIGRKNFLFSNTPRGATASAIIYSVVETAKANKLSPFHYLNYLFEKMPNTNLENVKELDKLLPFSDSLPDSCKIPIKK